MDAASASSILTSGADSGAGGAGSGAGSGGGGGEAVGAPTRVWHTDVKESITAIESGAILGNWNSGSELLVSTYSGKVVCWSGEVHTPVCTFTLPLPTLS